VRKYSGEVRKAVVGALDKPSTRTRKDGVKISFNTAVPAKKEIVSSSIFVKIVN
jgi:hypothetical protein